jgi:hypothetical protein
MRRDGRPSQTGSRWKRLAVRYQPTGSLAPHRARLTLAVAGPAAFPSTARQREGLA